MFFLNILVSGGDLLAILIVVVVNAVALVSQQAEYLRRNTRANLKVAEGAFDCSADVLVATAEVFRRLLEEGRLLATSLSCVVLDEAHYAVGRHPYAEVMAHIWKGEGSPRILGHNPVLPSSRITDRTIA